MFVPDPAAHGEPPPSNQWELLALGSSANSVHAVSLRSHLSGISLFSWASGGLQKACLVSWVSALPEYALKGLGAPQWEILNPAFGKVGPLAPALPGSSPVLAFPAETRPGRKGTLGKGDETGTPLFLVFFF